MEDNAATQLVAQVLTASNTVATPLELRVAALESKVAFLESTIKKHDAHFAKIKELTKLLDESTAEHLHS